MQTAGCHILASGLVRDEADDRHGDGRCARGDGPADGQIPHQEEIALVMAFLGSTVGRQRRIVARGELAIVVPPSEPGSGR